MKKLSCFKKWLTRFLKPDRDTLLELGKDIRTLALTVIGAALIGLSVGAAAPMPYGLTLSVAAVVWLQGMLLTRLANMIK